MPSFSAQATVFGYTFEGSPNTITAHYMIQDGGDWQGAATVTIPIAPGDSPHDVRQAVSAAIQTNPSTSDLNGSINIEYLV